MNVSTWRIGKARAGRFFMSLAILLALMTTLSSSTLAQPQAGSLPASAFSSDLARAWFDLQLRLVTRTWGFSPPVASRAFGYTGVTLYEALVPGMPGYQSLAGQLNELGEMPRPAPDQPYHWPAAANSALAHITRLLFPTAHAANKAAIDELYERFARQFQAEVENDVFVRSAKYGEMIAAVIYEWSMSDGGHESFGSNYPNDYQPPVGEGLWERTARAKGNPQPAMQPYWGENRPFVLASGSDCAPPPPPAYSEEPDSDFFSEAMVVFTTTNTLTAEQLEIARYWADDPFRTATPAGHSISILSQVLESEGAALGTAAEAYARLGIALADSFISCWHAKYEYNLLRPVTYIQKVIDPKWTPPLITPPFPEYPSGHSVESSAAAQALTDLFGEDYAFTDYTHEAWGLDARSFDSFTDFAEEAAVSRVYGGIHFPSAVENGLEQGNCVAQRVAALQFKTSS